MRSVKECTLYWNSFTVYWKATLMHVEWVELDDAWWFDETMYCFKCLIWFWVCLEDHTTKEIRDGFWKPWIVFIYPVLDLELNINGLNLERF